MNRAEWGLMIMGMMNRGTSVMVAKNGASTMKTLANLDEVLSASEQAATELKESTSRLAACVRGHKTEKAEGPAVAPTNGKTK